MPEGGWREMSSIDRRARRHQPVPPRSAPRPGPLPSRTAPPCRKTREGPNGRDSGERLAALAPGCGKCSAPLQERLAQL